MSNFRVLFSPFGAALLALGIALLGATAGLSAPADTLSDSALVAYARQAYDKTQKANHRDSLGIHHGTEVVADFPCSDICPDYTVRIIHYVISPGPDCDKIGGRAREHSVPVSIAVMRQSFCVPAVLVERKLD